MRNSAQLSHSLSGKYSLASVIRRFAMLYVFLLPFEMFMLPALGISPSKVVLPFLLVLHAISVGSRKTIGSARLFVMFILFLVSVIISYLYASQYLTFDANRFWQYSVSYLIGLYIFYLYFDLINRGVLQYRHVKKMYVYSLLMFALFAIYNIYCIEVSGGQPFAFLGEQYFQPLKNDNGIVRGDRIFLPTATPPRLSFVVGAFLLVLITHLLYGARFGRVRHFFPKVLLAVFYLYVMLGAGSRTGFVPLIISILAMWLAAYFWVSRRLASLHLILGTLFVSLILFIVFSSGLGGGERIAEVDFEEGSSLARHLLLRVQGVEVISGSEAATNFFGRGLGQYELYTDGVYSFTMMLTLFFETGIVGLTVSVWMFCYAIFGYRLGLLSRGSCSPLLRLTAFVIGFYILLANLFYELKGDPIMWVMFAIALAMPSLDRSRSENINSNNILQC